MSQKPLIILTGPTAVGKTALSTGLAKAVNGEIISADSMQVYRYMDIGTAKMKKEEMDGVTHYLIDEFDPDEEFHVYRFKECAKRYIDDIHARGKIPVLVGGTGFYIQAVLYDIDFDENETDSEYRRQLNELCRIHGKTYLHEMLREVDEESALKIHENNVKRVIRALEYYKQNQEPISRHNERESRKNSPYRYLYFVLNDDRAVLYGRIDKRVDAMAANGLVEEVKDLQNRGYTRELVSMQGLGYKEILAYLSGECTLEEALYRIKRDTRHFAKRQLTWFGREKDVIWINKQDYGRDDSKILEVLLDRIKQEWKEDKDNHEEKC